MADVKWIKLATALPDNRKIKQIRRLPEGDTIALMWIFLMCLAGETNDDGMVYFMPEIPYTEEMLADQFAIDINTVRLGLTTFQRFGMIEIIDDIICLPSWEKWQSVDKLSEIREQTRKRVAKHREKQKLSAGNVTCNVTVTESNATDKEEELDIKNKKEDKKKSVKESPHTLFLRLVPEYVMGDALKAKMGEWITYKTERKEPYKETGLKSLLRKVENNAQTHGDQALIDLIDECMASGWKGIIFDRLENKPAKARSIQRPVYQKQTKAEEMNEFYNMAASWAAESE